MRCPLSLKKKFSRELCRWKEDFDGWISCAVIRRTIFLCADRQLVSRIGSVSIRTEIFLAPYQEMAESEHVTNSLRSFVGNILVKMSGSRIKAFWMHYMTNLDEIVERGHPSNCFFMTLAWKFRRGHLVIGSSVRPSVCPSVCLSVCP